MTMYSVVTCYCICSLKKMKMHPVFITLATVFYALNPINLIYAVGMWKDSFFSILFLATLTCSYSAIAVDKKADRHEVLLKLFFLALAASLSRNSGWSALLVFSVFLLIWGIKNRDKFIRSIACCISIAAILSLIISFVALPKLGISNGGDNVARSIPLQQIARTVCDNELSEEEIADISYWIKSDSSYSDIIENYRPEISDPMKRLFDGQKISQNSKEFNDLWLSLGRKYYKSYLDATLDHTRAYFWPWEQIWRFDNSIFENPYGVTKSAKIKPGTDIAASVYESYLSKIPFYKAWNSGAIVLWLTIIGIMYSVQIRVLGSFG